MRYAILITHHDGSYEVIGPYEPSTVERWREKAEGLAWVERASVVQISSPGTLRLEWKEANRRVL